MGNIRDIKRRIGSIISTRQITNAMKMVAASNLRKAQARILAARPYADLVDLMLRTIKLRNPTLSHPLLQESKGTKTLLVVVTADRGLCGGFNSAILRSAREWLAQNPGADLICFGRRAYDFFRKTPSANIIGQYLGYFNSMDFSVSRKVGADLVKLFLDGEYKEIRVLYNEFKSAIQQNIINKPLFPVAPLPSDVISDTDFICEPDEEAVVEELAKKYVDVELWRVMLESSAAEQGARMTAMDNATENASDLIDKLTLQYNRERQSAITTEIIEIASGAEAINQ